MIRVLASLLLSNKKLVKGKNFNNHIVVGNPVTTILAHENHKADEILLVDLDAHQKKSEPDIETLKIISEINSTPLTFGGGIRSLEIAKKIITNGADKILIDTNLHKNKNFIREIIKTFGRQAVIASLNLIEEGNEMKLFNNKIKKNPIDIIKEIEELGVGEIKVTYVHLEGTRKGIDLNYSKKIAEIARIPIIFEGGIGSLKHIEEFYFSGLDSIALGELISFTENNIIKIKSFLQKFSNEIRV